MEKTMIKYKEFKIGDLFEKLPLKKCPKDENVSKIESKEYSIPLVYAKKGDNGIMYYAKEGNFTKYSNVISIIYNGAIASGLVYAHERPTGILAESYFIRIKKEICDNVPFGANLYMKTAIEKSIYYKYSRDNLATWNNKVENDIIYLPVNDKNEVDFEYMDNYIKGIKEKCISNFSIYLNKNKLTKFKIRNEEYKTLNENKKFKEFEIKSIFEISTGRDVIINNTKDGSIPLISHQHDNNGIAKLIEKLDDRRLFNHKDTISLADRGVFLATTQDKDFYIGTRVKALTFKNGEQSENVRLFFVAAINKLQILFKEYLNNATDKLPDLKIMLPIDDNNEIDYDYMEKYITAQKERVLKPVVEIKNKL